MNSQETGEEEKLARKFANGNVTPERLALEKEKRLFIRLLINLSRPPPSVVLDPIPAKLRATISVPRPIIICTAN